MAALDEALCVESAPQKKGSARFQKNRRLLSAGDYKKVFDNNNFRASDSLLLILAYQEIPAKKKPARLGLVIGKKNVPRAVDRNNAKRLLRECFRQLNNPFFVGVDFVVVARKGLAGANNQESRKAIHFLFGKIEKQMVRQKNKANA